MILILFFELRDMRELRRNTFHTVYGDILILQQSDSQKHSPSTTQTMRAAVMPATVASRLVKKREKKLRMLTTMQIRTLTTSSPQFMSLKLKQRKGRRDDTQRRHVKEKVIGVVGKVCPGITCWWMNTQKGLTASV